VWTTTGLKTLHILFMIELDTPFQAPSPIDRGGDRTRPSPSAGHRRRAALATPADRSTR
jgi:hypothetical protein